MGNIVRAYWDGKDVKRDVCVNVKSDNGQYPYISALELEFG